MRIAVHEWSQGLVLVWFSFGTGGAYVLLMWFINVYIKASSRMILAGKSLSRTEFALNRGKASELVSVAPEVLRERRIVLLSGLGFGIVWTFAAALIAMSWTG